MGAILVVDDDAQVLEVVSEMLKLEGHAVTAVSNGLQATAEFHSSHFDLVITDLIMPEREGLETISEMRRTTSTVPIIAISGGGRIGPADYLASAAQLGANATLAKPFKRKELVSTVSELLGTSGAA